jgi:hypothetical protein
MQDAEEPPSSPPNLPLAFRRKRFRDETCSSLPSSDPAFFSSDDGLDASIDNYSQPRRKKKFQGAWWCRDQLSEEAPTRKPKAPLSRNMDSGVWMGSDGIDEDGLENGEDGNLRNPIDRSLSIEEKAALKSIEESLENGNEVFDLQ